MRERGFAWRHTAEGVVFGAAAIAAVSGVIAVLQHGAQPIGLAGLYLFAILPVAVRWGFGLAGLVAVASYLTFTFFFVEPIHSIEFNNEDTAATLLIALVTAYVVSELARRAHARAREAEHAQAEQRRLADEQAALRRVAKLVAQAVSNTELFEAVTREVGLQCDADLARMERFEPDRTVTAIAEWSRTGAGRLAVGSRIPLEGASIAAQVLDTGQPARVDSFAGESGPIADEARTLGIRSSVGCPIVVGAQPWGVIAASKRRAEPFPENTEARIARFTELVAMAVSNAEARAELLDSRARVLTAADDARRRVTQDLHDGAQQRLVHTIITLKLARRAQQNAQPAAELVNEALEQAELANSELRELAHGILPQVLARGGLSAGVDALVSRVRVPVTVDVPEERFAAEIEASAYFIVAEALTNVAKHSQASSATVTARADDGELHLDVRDDGVGGARLDGSGLLGLHDRVDALGGELRVESPPGNGTRIAATLPLRR
jgi:signal transduction histidine kinase